MMKHWHSQIPASILFFFSQQKALTWKTLSGKNRPNKNNSRWFPKKFRFCYFLEVANIGLNPLTVGKYFFPFYEGKPFLIFTIHCEPVLRQDPNLLFPFHPGSVWGGIITLWPRQATSHGLLPACLKNLGVRVGGLGSKLLGEKPMSFFWKIVVDTHQN